MADGSNYRYRRGDDYGRSDAGQGDPLAELARLIGQNDPFSDFARGEQGRPSSYGQQSAPGWAAHRESPQAPQAYSAPQAYPDSSYRDPAPRYSDPRYAEPRYDDPYPSPDSHADPRYADSRYADNRYADSQYGDGGYAETDRYGAHGYDSGAGQAYSNPGYSDPAYSDPNYHQAYADGSAQGAAPYGYESDPHYGYGTLPRDEDIYERPRRADKRGGLVTVIAVLALAVVGTAGAFAYRTVFSKSGTPLSPPVIKADPGPNKVVPAGQGDQAIKVIRDRVGEGGQERVVSREEQPVDVRNQPMRTIMPGSPNPVTGLPNSANTTTMPTGGGAASFAAPAATGSAFNTSAASPPPAPAAAPAGSSSTEPRKIKTIPIRPDQADAEASAPRASAPARTASVEPSARTRPQPSDGSAPLSLSPAASRSAASATRTAVVAPPPAPAPAAVEPSGNEPGSYVQVTSQRSEADARSSWRSLQSKYPGLLGSRQAAIRRADLGAKGVYYRALVGPFASAGEAGDLCNSLKSAGASCIVH